MVRGKAGRARFASNLRATVREFIPEPEPDCEEPIITTSRKIERPADLADLCERAGATVRRTTGGGHLIRGPEGTAVLPAHWGNGRSRANTIAQVRRIGLELVELEAVQSRKPEGDQIEEEEEEPVTLTATEVDSVEVEHDCATQGDVGALLDLCEVISKRVASLEASVDDRLRQLNEAVQKAIDVVGNKVVAGDSAVAKALRKEIHDLEVREDKRGRAHALKITEVSIIVERLEKAAESAHRAVQADKFQVIRDKIVEWFRTLPPGMRMPAVAVTSNLCGDGDDAAVYRNQLARLVELGELQKHSSRGNRGGGSQYSLVAAGETQSA